MAQEAAERNKKMRLQGNSEEENAKRREASRLKSEEFLQRLRMKR